MNERMNLHLRHKPRFTVAARRRMLGWAICLCSLALLGLLCYLYRH